MHSWRCGSLNIQQSLKSLHFRPSLAYENIEGLLQWSLGFANSLLTHTDRNVQLAQRELVLAALCGLVTIISSSCLENLSMTPPLPLPA